MAESRHSKKAGNGGKISPSYTDSDNESLQEIECKICNQTFLDTNSYQQHINGKKHQSKLMRKKMASNQKAIAKLDLEHSNSEEDENLDSKFTELNCDVCSKTFSGYKPYISHLQGSVHAKNQKKQDLKEKMKGTPGIESDEDSDDGLLPKPVARCSLCEKEFTDLESFRKHLKSSLHKKKTLDQKIMESIKADHQESDAEIEDGFYKKCEVCDKEFSGIKPYHIHMNSCVHKRALKKREMEQKIKELCTIDDTSKYICNECKKPFLDPFSFQAHIENNSHKKYEAKNKIMEFVHSNPYIVVGKTVENLSSDVDETDSYHVGDYLLLCKLCHMSFTGPESATDHVKSRKHLRAKQEREVLKALKQKQETKQAASDSSKKGAKLSENGPTEKNGKLPGQNLKVNMNESNDDFELV